MAAAAPNAERPSVPLTRFHNNTGEFLDMGLISPVTLTKHGRPQWTISEAGYFARIEALAAGNILEALNRQHTYSADLSQETRDRIASQMPTAEELTNDRWADE